MENKERQEIIEDWGTIWASMRHGREYLTNFLLLFLALWSLRPDGQLQDALFLENQVAWGLVVSPWYCRKFLGAASMPSGWKCDICKHVAYFMAQGGIGDLKT